MSLIGSYRQSGIIATGTNVGASGSQSIVDFTGFRPSGLAAGNAMAVCLYVWSGAGYPSNEGNWIPLKREWCT